MMRPLLFAFVSNSDNSPEIFLEKRESMKPVPVESQLCGMTAAVTEIEVSRMEIVNVCPS